MTGLIRARPYPGAAAQPRAALLCRAGLQDHPIKAATPPRRPRLRGRPARSPGRAAAPPSPLGPVGHSIAARDDVDNPASFDQLHFDFLVLGSGIAGLTYALKAAEHGSVAVVTKDTVREGCTVYAQGGVCAVLDPLDSVQAHAKDTMVAGCFLNDERAVNVVCSEGAARVLELAELGANFTRTAGGDLHLTREGGHSHRRIVHAADATGAEIAAALSAQVAAHPNIHVFEHHMCTDLVMAPCSGAMHCFGVDALRVRNNRMVRFVAKATMLATGGAGQLFPNTTNPEVATGDGLAMAWRAGAEVANMEFMQFHPTALFDPTAHGRRSLITEAVRGEGGLLRNQAGERFMADYDARLELAPRDVVARAIHDQLKRRGEDYVLLDISHKPPDDVLAHFPNIAARCAAIGIDITRQPIPVVPVQHYCCGGVQTGLQGETTLPGLFACGEVAHTGLHGANRLASNSLLEALVFASRAVSPAVAHAEHAGLSCSTVMEHVAGPAGWSGFKGPSAARPPNAKVALWIQEAVREVKEAMWHGAGIERDESGLAEAAGKLDWIKGHLAAPVSVYGVSKELYELRNLVDCGALVLEAARARKESRGLHFRTDYIEKDEAFDHATVLHKGEQVDGHDAVGDPVWDGIAGKDLVANASVAGVA